MLLKEVINFLTPTIKNNVTDHVLVDATVGFGGHSSAFISFLPDIRHNITFHVLDADLYMLEIAKKRLEEYSSTHTIYYHHKFFDDFFNAQTQSSIDIILMDLGLSMYHFLKSGRGFSKNEDAPLDMRLSHLSTLTAADIVNSYTPDDIIRVLYEYGEERQAVKWVNRIVSARRIHSIESVAQLCEALQLGKKSSDRPILTRIFQALRIEVNDELNRLQRALPLAWNSLRKNGRMAVISFHSLEDRIVKFFFKHMAGTFKNPEIMPIYDTGLYGSGIILTKKPVVPSASEIEENSASRSAKLRVAEKII